MMHLHIHTVQNGFINAQCIKRTKQMKENFYLLNFQIDFTNGGKPV